MARVVSMCVSTEHFWGKWGLKGSETEFSAVRGDPRNHSSTFEQIRASAQGRKLLGEAVLETGDSLSQGEGSKDTLNSYM